MPSEADKTTLFLKYSKHFLNYSYAFEAKIVKDPSMPFDAVKDHQINALYQVKHGTFNYKISDVGYDQKPYDGFQFYRAPAYVVIFWAQKRGDRRFTMTDIDMFCEEKRISDRKSLTYERACIISAVVGEL